MTPQVVDKSVRFDQNQLIVCLPVKSLLSCVTLEQFCFQKNFSFDSRLAAEQLILDQESKEKTGKKTIKDFSHKLQFCFCFVSSVQYIMSLGLDLIILVVFQY